MHTATLQHPQPTDDLSFPESAALRLLRDSGPASADRIQPWQREWRHTAVVDAEITEFLTALGIHTPSAEQYREVEQRLQRYSVAFHCAAALRQVRQ